MRSQNSITRIEWLCTVYPFHYVDNQFEMGDWNEEVKPYYTIIALTLRFILLREMS